MLVELAGGGRGLEMYSHMTVQVGLVTRPVLTDRTDEWFLSGVNLEVTVQQSFPHESLPTARPGAGVTLAVNLLGVSSHVRLPEESDAAAEVRGGEPLVHGHHVSLEVVPPVGLVLTLGVAAPEWFVLPLSLTVAVRRGQLAQLFLTPLIHGG